MADIEKPDLTNKWAEEGAVIKPTDAKIRLGWTSEVPPHQWQNWWQQRVDSSLSYSLQKGIPEWDEEAEYIANKSFVQLGGDIYKCIQTNTGENPSSKPAYWKPLRDVYSEELELGSASRVDMGTGGTQIRTNSQNDSRYIQGGSVTQSTGSSTTNVMSQKAVTDAFDNLGTAAKRDVGTSAGNVMEVGAFGLGRVNASSVSEIDEKAAGFYAAANGVQDNPLNYSSVIYAPYIQTGRYNVLFLGNNSNRIIHRRVRDGATEDMELHHTGNIRTSTGNNDEFPMSQKAVTDALDTKVDINGNQTIGGIKAFSSFPITPTEAPTSNYQVANKKYVDDSALGVGQTWQDVAGSRSKDTTYTNTTGRTIIVKVVGRSASAGQRASIRLLVDGVAIDFCQITDDSLDANAYPNVSAVVPNGSSYKVEQGAFDSVIHYWMELR